MILVEYVYHQSTREFDIIVQDGILFTDGAVTVIFHHWGRAFVFGVSVG